MYWRTGRALMDQMEEATHLDGQYRDIASRRRELDLEGARVLQRMEEIDGWRCVGAASEADFGERHGVPAGDARNQLGLGRVIKAVPSLEEQVRAGQITVPSAALLGQVLSDPRLQREGDDWVGWAQSDSTRGFRKRVQRRREEVAHAGEEIVAICLHVAERALEDFHRAKVIASRKAGEPQTEGQTFAAMADTYLEQYDEERVTPGTRRTPHTSLVDGRNVPEEVEREIYARQGRRCAVPYCDNSIYLDKAHLVAHECGGSREADNLVLLCWRHHRWLDAGYLKITGTVANPRFTDREGRDLTQRFAMGGLDRVLSPGVSEVLPGPKTPVNPRALPDQEAPPGSGVPQDSGEPPDPPGPAGGTDPP